MKQKALSLTQQDLAAIAITASTEADPRSGNYQAQYQAVVNTILARMAATGKPAVDIVNAGAQFSAISDSPKVTGDVLNSPASYTFQKSPKMQAAAASALLNALTPNSDSTGLAGATQFYNPDKSNPSWGPGLLNTMQIGDAPFSHLHGFSPNVKPVAPVPFAPLETYQALMARVTQEDPNQYKDPRSDQRATAIYNAQTQKIYDMFGFDAHVSPDRVPAVDRIDQSLPPAGPVTYKDLGAALQAALSGGAAVAATPMPAPAAAVQVAPAPSSMGANVQNGDQRAAPTGQPGPVTKYGFLFNGTNDPEKASDATYENTGQNIATIKAAGLTPIVVLPNIDKFPKQNAAVAQAAADANVKTESLAYDDKDPLHGTYKSMQALDQKYSSLGTIAQIAGDSNGVRFAQVTGSKPVGKPGEAAIFGPAGAPIAKVGATSAQIVDMLDQAAPMYDPTQTGAAAVRDPLRTPKAPAVAASADPLTAFAERLKLQALPAYKPDMTKFGPAIPNGDTTGWPFGAVQAKPAPAPAPGLMSPYADATAAPTDALAPLPSNGIDWAKAFASTPVPGAGGPMQNPDGSYALTYGGKTNDYNFAEADMKANAGIVSTKMQKGVDQFNDASAKSAVQSLVDRTMQMLTTPAAPAPAPGEVPNAGANADLAKRVMESLGYDFVQPQTSQDLIPQNYASTDFMNAVHAARPQAVPLPPQPPAELGRLTKPAPYDPTAAGVGAYFRPEPLSPVTSSVQYDPTVPGAGAYGNYQSNAYPSTRMALAREAIGTVPSQDTAGNSELFGGSYRTQMKTPLGETYYTFGTPAVGRDVINRPLGTESMMDPAAVNAAIASYLAGPTTQYATDNSTTRKSVSVDANGNLTITTPQNPGLVASLFNGPKSLFGGMVDSGLASTAKGFEAAKNAALSAGSTISNSWPSFDQTFGDAAAASTSKPSVSVGVPFAEATMAKGAMPQGSKTPSQFNSAFDFLAPPTAPTISTAAASAALAGVKTGQGILNYQQTPSILGYQMVPTYKTVPVTPAPVPVKPSTDFTYGFAPSGYLDKAMAEIAAAKPVETQQVITGYTKKPIYSTVLTQALNPQSGPQFSGLIGAALQAGPQPWGGIGSNNMGWGGRTVMSGGGGPITGGNFGGGVVGYGPGGSQLQGGGGVGDWSGGGSNTPNTGTGGLY